MFLAVLVLEEVTQVHKRNTFTEPADVAPFWLYQQLCVCGQQRHLTNIEAVAPGLEPPGVGFP